LRIEKCGRCRGLPRRSIGVGGCYDKALKLKSSNSGSFRPPRRSAQRGLKALERLQAPIHVSALFGIRRLAFDVRRFLFGVSPTRLIFYFINSTFYFSHPSLTRPHLSARAFPAGIDVGSPRLEREVFEFINRYIVGITESRFTVHGFRINAVSPWSLTFDLWNALSVSRYRFNPSSPKDEVAVATTF
jgi:hypothetical protein